MSRFRRHNPEKQRKFGDRNEDEIAKRGGYRKTTASGSKGEKGDLIRGGFVIEAKATRHESYRITTETLNKLRNDGLTQGGTGVLTITLGNGRTYAVMDLSTFEALTDAGKIQEHPE